MRANEECWDDILGHLKQRVLVPIANTTAELLARWIGQRLLKNWPGGGLPTAADRRGRRQRAVWGL